MVVVELMLTRISSFQENAAVPGVFKEPWYCPWPFARVPSVSSRLAISEPPELDELEDDELELDELLEELEDELELDDELDELDDDELDELLLLDDELLDEELVPPGEPVPPQAASANVSAPALISFARRR